MHAHQHSRRVRSGCWGAVLVAAGALSSACGGGPAATPTAPTANATVMPPASPTSAPMPVSGSTSVLRRAVFQSANGYRTEGAAQITRSESGHRLELQEDFRTSTSGILEVRLCRETRCGASDLNLGSLRAFTGSQTYNLPDDSGTFRFVVIWCRAVNLPFGFGDLR